MNKQAYFPSIQHSYYKVHTLGYCNKEEHTTNSECMADMYMMVRNKVYFQNILHWLSMLHKCVLVSIEECHLSIPNWFYTEHNKELHRQAAQYILHSRHMLHMYAKQYK